MSIDYLLSPEFIEKCIFISTEYVGHDPRHSIGCAWCGDYVDRGRVDGAHSNGWFTQLVEHYIAKHPAVIESFQE